jgi:hypothetical protein
VRNSLSWSDREHFEHDLVACARLAGVMIHVPGDSA